MSEQKFRTVRTIPVDENTRRRIKAFGEAIAAANHQLWLADNAFKSEYAKVTGMLEGGQFVAVSEDDQSPSVLIQELV